MHGKAIDGEQRHQATITHLTRKDRAYKEGAYNLRYERELYKAHDDECHSTSSILTRNYGRRSLNLRYEILRPFRPLVAGGRTPLGASVELALDLLQKRREYYRSAGIEHYKPIMMIMSDGQPTEVESVVYNAAQRCSDMVITEGLKVLPIGVGDSARLDILDMFSPNVKAKCITNMDVFVKLFEMLSVSMSQSDNTVFDWLNDQV